MNQSKKCDCCNRELPLDKFPVSNRYKGKITRRKICKSCYAGKYRLGNREKKRDEFNKLIGWPCTLLSVGMLVTGIYSHDYIKGRNRICFYDSVVGSHAYTIDAMQMCPLTKEFDV